MKMEEYGEMQRQNKTGNILHTNFASDQGFVFEMSIKIFK